MINEKNQIDGAIFETYVISNYDDRTYLEHKHPFVVICPGGGYSFIASRSAECIALMFNAAGFNAGVLTYSIAPEHRFPTQLCQLAKAVSIVRENADRWYTDADAVAVMGFSAGGHLAASLGTMWHEDWLDEASCTTKEQRKPNALLLAYPVITVENGHKGTFDNLLGPDATMERRQEMSLEKRVTSNMVPTFIWSTWTDAVVPVESSLEFACALRRAGISCELHIYREGEHGLGLATKEFICPKHPAENVRVSRWANEATTWLDQVLRK